MTGTEQMTQVALRPVEPGDAAGIVALEQELFTDQAWTADQLLTELAAHGTDRWYAVLESEDTVLGYVGLRLEPPNADIQTVAVHPRLRGAGQARRLVSAAIAQAWALQCSRIFLEVRADNPAALHLYGSLGFVRLGLRKRHYADGCDAVSMRLRRSELPPLGQAT